MSKAMTIFIGWLLMSAPAMAKDNPVKPTSRAEQWRLMREQKEQNLRPEQIKGFERVLFVLKDERILEKFQAGLFGFHPKIGGLETGSGFGFGTEFRPSALENGNVQLRVAAQASLKGYQRYEVGVRIPEFVGSRLFLDFSALQRNSPQQDFFGIGMDSREADRSSFRYEATDIGATLGGRVTEWLEAGAVAGSLKVNTATGTDKRFPSVEQAFDESQVPALFAQPDYIYSGVFAAADTRDEKGNPRSGARYAVDWRAYNDSGNEGYGFNRLDAEVQHYFPFFNKRRVIAFRGRTVLTHTGEDNVVPFFMQPALGGSEDLRGFREFRFRDRNLMVMNLEYRWEAFSGLDVALFGDAGKVFHSTRDLNFENLEKSYGFGFRFNTSKSVFWRIDTAFSKEGTRVFLKFGHVF